MLSIKYVQFLRGDVDKNDVVNIVDVIYLVNFLFKSGPEPNCSRSKIVIPGDMRIKK